VPTIPSDFEIVEDWYQAYVRFEPRGLTGKRLKAYFRAGVSLVQAELTDKTVFPALGLYEQTDETEDLLGNLGFGARYILYSTARLRFNLQFEGEGFYGKRSQQSLEVLPQAELGVPFVTRSLHPSFRLFLQRCVSRVHRCGPARQIPADRLPRPRRF
jgi:hypothetical protein